MAPPAPENFCDFESQELPAPSGRGHREPRHTARIETHRASLARSEDRRQRRQQALAHNKMPHSESPLQDVSTNALQQFPGPELRFGEDTDTDFMFNWSHSGVNADILPMTSDIAVNLGSFSAPFGIPSPAPAGYGFTMPMPAPAAFDSLAMHHPSATPDRSSLYIPRTTFMAPAPAAEAILPGHHQDGSLVHVPLPTAESTDDAAGLSIEADSNLVDEQLPRRYADDCFYACPTPYTAHHQKGLVRRATPSNPRSPQTPVPIPATRNPNLKRRVTGDAHRNASSNAFATAAREGRENVPLTASPPVASGMEIEQDPSNSGKNMGFDFRDNVFDDGDDNDSLDDVDEDDDIAHPKKKAKKDRSARGLGVQHQDLLDIAYKHFKLLLCTEGAWANTDNMDTLVIESWGAACEEKDLAYTPTTKDRSLIRDRAPQVRGVMKTIARGLLPQQFGFKQGHSNEVKEHNRALVVRLKHKAAHAHVDPASPTTLCRNPIITDILTKMWFVDAEDDGIRYQEYFVGGPSLAMIAQVLTVIECAIDEYATGTHVKLDMRARKYKPVYLEHLNMLNNWEAYSKMRSRASCRMQEDLLQTLRSNAGALEDAAVVRILDQLTDDDFAAMEN